MTRKGLSSAVSKQLGLSQNLVKRVIDRTLLNITESLARGERVELRNFGVFSLRIRESKIGRNPRTGRSVFIPSRKVVFFKPGKEMKQRINR